VEEAVFVNLAACFGALSSKRRICREYIDSGRVFMGEAGAGNGATPDVTGGSD
jgi:hypothetical protein